MGTRFLTFVLAGAFLALPTVVNAQGPAPKPIRVLLFADGPMREYQFVRSVLEREAKAKRMEVSVFLQTKDAKPGLQDVAALRLLSEFPEPGKLGPSLNDFDVVIAFDPDWTKLSEKNRKALKDWVGKHAGGLLYVAGAVYTHQLRRSAGNDLDPIKDIVPVVVKDSRLHGIGIGAPGGQIPKPFALKFAPNAKDYEFLKLDPKGDGPTAGWNGYFWNDEKFDPEAKLQRGFYASYPIERLKPGAEVVAAIDSPKEFLLGKDYKPQPFLVVMPYGNGKTMYLGSAETWRLRGFKESYHEHLWIGLVRYLAASKLEPKAK